MRKFRFSIMTLLVCVTLLAVTAAYYGRVWHDLNEKWIALQDLESNYYGEVIVLTSPRFLPEETSVVNWPTHWFFGQGRVERLYAPKHIRFYDAEGSAECINLLIQIPNINSTGFGDNKLSMAMFDRLSEHGIEVDHWGLKDFTVPKNYVYNSLHYHPMDPQKMRILGVLYNAEDSFEFIAEGSAFKHRYASQHFGGNFETCEFGAGLDWRDLAERHFKPVFTDNDNHGHFCDGQTHYRPEHHEFRIGSREGNVFHFEWNCYNEFGGRLKAKFEIPFTEVAITPYAGITSIEQAKELVARQFNLNDFEEPVEGSWYTYHFPLKEGLRKVAPPRPIQ